MQGFNMGRYVPPDVEGTLSANALHNKHRPSSAAHPPTVRFEMPFAAWCASCPRPTLIPQGVRFNAQKRRAGGYLSTPIWSFTFRHAECGGPVEVRTDPKNTAYVVVSGATKRSEPAAGAGVADVVAGEGLLTDPERDRQRAGAFASLERTIADRAALRQAARRIDALRGLAARDGDDPYARNQALRRAFRAGRRERQRGAAEAEALRGRLGLGEGLEILPETEGDRRRAAGVEFGGESTDAGAAGDRALRGPLFGRFAVERGSKVETRKAEKGKQGLVSELVSNARAAQDPFLQARGDRTPRALLGVKRKQAADAAAPDPSASTSRGSEAAQIPPPPSARAPTVPGGLVAYDSEDE